MSKELEERAKALSDIKAMSEKRLALWRDVCAAQNAKMLREWAEQSRRSQDTSQNKNS